MSLPKMPAETTTLGTSIAFSILKRPHRATVCYMYATERRVMLEDRLVIRTFRVTKHPYAEGKWTVDVMCPVSRIWETFEDGPFDSAEDAAMALATRTIG